MTDFSEHVLRDYFLGTAEDDPLDVARAKADWRMSCFQSGLRYADYIESQLFSLEGKSVLDAACAWGGHAIAFALRGARVVATDLIDHEFVRLKQFCGQHNLNVQFGISNCEQLPFVAGSFDVILALELIEHIDSVERFADEVTRLLRPGGVCLISTPPRLRSMIEGEPHYGIRGLTLLPFRLQGIVARKLFRRSYPYPIPRQYSRSAQVIRTFRARGLDGDPVLWGWLGRKLRQFSPLQRLGAQLLWNFILIKKPDI